MAEQAGACAVSVVTESTRFGGSIDMLREVAGACSVPVLQKDFFSEPDQVDESREAGAASFLIIMSCTSDRTAQTLYEHGRKLGMEPVAEVHTAAELERALVLNPTLVGINNRDIGRLELDAGDVGVTERLAPVVPEDIVIISESSLQSSDDVRRAFAAGANAVLIGTAILQAEDFQSYLKDLMKIQAGTA
jgi:indole-3-glycerol phosphate synthase